MIDNNSTLAVVIPFYKLQFFGEVLKSLSQQTNKNFKVYIGNDASPEDPEDLINYHKKDINIFYKKFDQNLGGFALTKQWERCIDLVEKEDWIMILGDDDYLSNNCVEKFYEVLDEVKLKKFNVIRYATIEINGNSEVISGTFNHPTLELATDAYYRKLFKRSRSSLSEYVFKKETYGKYKFRDFPLAWGSDNMAWLEFSEGRSLYTINNSVVYFRLSSENISRNNFKEEIKLEARHQFFKIFLRKYFIKYNKNQKLNLLNYFEQLTYKLKKTGWRFYLEVLFLYLKNFQFIQGLKFTRRLIIHINGKA